MKEVTRLCLAEVCVSALIVSAAVRDYFGGFSIVGLLLIVFSCCLLRKQLTVSLAPGKEHEIFREAQFKATRPNFDGFVFVLCERDGRRQFGSPSHIPGRASLLRTCSGSSPCF
jgi:hypothetical protein